MRERMPTTASLARPRRRQEGPAVVLPITSAHMRGYKLENGVICGVNGSGNSETSDPWTRGVASG